MLRRHSMCCSRPELIFWCSTTHLWSLQVGLRSQVCCSSTMILHLASAGLLKRARSTSTSGPGSSAVIESLPRAFAVVDGTRVLRLLRADDQIVLARLNDPSDLEQFPGQAAEWLGR
jgi:hypothetical protein